MLVRTFFTLWKSTIWTEDCGKQDHSLASSFQRLNEKLPILSFLFVCLFCFSIKIRAVIAVENRMSVFLVMCPDKTQNEIQKWKDVSDLHHTSIPHAPPGMVVVEEIPDIKSVYLQACLKYPVREGGGNFNIYLSNLYSIPSPDKWFWMMRNDVRINDKKSASFLTYCLQLVLNLVPQLGPEFEFPSKAVVKWIVLDLMTFFAIVVKGIMWSLSQPSLSHSLCLSKGHKWWSHEPRMLINYYKYLWYYL